jgi:hypothetical protein
VRLTDLDPRWLIKDGSRVGFLFRCPLEPSNSNRLQSCFFQATPRREQWDIVETALGEDREGHVQFCRPDFGWSCSPSPEQATFENITITPSIDGSAGGNWHGFITNGDIVGGL